MGKSDKSIHNICIASIRRSAMKPYDFKWTRFYEENADFKNSFPEIEIGLSDNELVICSTVIDIDHFSVLTTQILLLHKEASKLLRTTNFSLSMMTELLSSNK